jgi:protein PhnA
MNLAETLLNRCNFKCELCTTGSNLTVYNVPPVVTVSAENSIMVCETCKVHIDHPTTDVNHWRCLSESMWSEHSAVQVMAFRILKKISNEVWARDLLDQLLLDDETLKWAETVSM